MKLYLAGSVPKGDKDAENYHDWRKEYIAIISQKIKKVELFDPNVFIKLEGNSFALTGADCMYIQQSDLVIVNAEEKLGAGTAMELIIAKYFKKPVITVLPKNTHHRRSNVYFEGRLVEDWIHPFIDTFSDCVVDKPEELASMIDTMNKKPVKNITVIDEAITYAKTMLEK